MLALLLSLVSPVHAASPAGAGWASAGVAVGAGATMFVPGAYGYGAAVTTLNPPNCGEFPDCEGYGFGLMIQSSLVGGTTAYGMSAAAAGAITHGLLVKQGAWKVLVAGGATTLVATGLTAGGLAISQDGDMELGLGLLGAGIVGNLVGVPLAVGLASRGEAKAAREEIHHPEPALTGIGVAPMHDGASVSVSLRF